MDFEAALTTRVLALAGVSALVANRVNWEDRPQGKPLPAVTLQIIEDDRDQHMGGVQDMLRAMVQADVWSLTYAAAKTIKEALIAGLLPAAVVGGVSFRRAFVTARSLPERTEQGLIYRPSMDFTFFYSAQ